MSDDYGVFGKGDEGFLNFMDDENYKLPSGGGGRRPSGNGNSGWGWSIVILIICIVIGILSKGG